MKELNPNYICHNENKIVDYISHFNLVDYVLVIANQVFNLADFTVERFDTPNYFLDDSNSLIGPYEAFISQTALSVVSSNLRIGLEAFPEDKYLMMDQLRFLIDRGYPCMLIKREDLKEDYPEGIILRYPEMSGERSELVWTRQTHSFVDCRRIYFKMFFHYWDYYEGINQHACPFFTE